MIFPLSHERMSARRWPMVTTIIALLCVAAQIWVSRPPDPAPQDDGSHVRVVEFFAEHPYLELRPGALPEIDDETLKLGHTLAQATGRPDDDVVREEQKQLDALVAAASTGAAAPREDPFRRFGYVPAEHNWLALFTSPFVHSGWLHLAGNMWFLFFCGMTLEDRWGRLVFPLFYVAAGAAAALVHGALAPHDLAPLVGASGAIAGCMGAFAVAFARTPVRFLWMLSIRPRTFTAPAYVVLPVWAVFEALWGLLLPGSTTAHWAHVGGFVFGVVVGLALHRSGLDRRLDDAVEVASVLGGDPRIDEARRMLRVGLGAEALAMLEGLAIERPDSAVVYEALASTARAMGDEGQAERAQERARRLRAASS